MAMTRDEFITNVAKLVAGLQVLVSMRGNPEILGAAAEPWQALLHEKGGFGWTNAEELEKAFRTILSVKGDHV